MGLLVGEGAVLLLLLWGGGDWKGGGGAALFCADCLRGRGMSR